MACSYGGGNRPLPLSGNKGYRICSSQRSLIAPGYQAPGCQMNRSPAGTLRPAPMSWRRGGLSITPFGLAFYELVIGSKHSELILLILVKEARRLTNRLALAQG